MARLFVFADEAGDFEFAKKANVSRYFILCSVSMRSCAVGNGLIELRRKLVWEGVEVGDYFHASNDKQAVRNAVFSEIRHYDFRVHATLMEKSKAQTQVRKTRAIFYQYGWFYHFKHVAPRIISAESEILVTAASLGTGKERASFVSAVNNVMGQVITKNKHVANCCPATADPCLQVADYCAWAIQRKWEQNDHRSYDLIKDRIIHEYDMWSHGKTHYY